MAAETVVSLVLGKLADAAIKEVLFLYGVGEKVESMERELGFIQSFLKDADMKQKGDNRVQHWVNEVRRVAFRIEDTIDMFLAEIESINHTNVVKRMLKKPAKIIARHKLGIELDKIKTSITEISERRSTYGITNIGEGSGSEVQRPVRRLAIPEIDDTVIVGFEADKKFITEQLLNGSTSRRSVVSIVGTGGLGKTTLALKVYKSPEVKKNFNFQTWISVSREFKLIDILRTMLKKIQPNTSEEQINKLMEEDLILKLNVSLRERKYLIVMDDVWTNDLWAHIGQVFPDFNNGSRILITTRFINIAKSADPLSNPYELPFLNEHESLELFVKNAIPDKKCSSDLIKIAMQFAKKCDGLPLALVVLGRFLSIKPRTCIAWDKIFKQMNWGNVGGNCREIIATSYEDLPPVLKSCFMYFALFPEDYRIEAKWLIRMWVAEGFIPKEENQTMEETAELYLEELVERSMVQVAKRDYNSSIKYCRIHDLLRDLAIQRAKENDFLMVFSNNADDTGCNTVRRAAVHNVCPSELIKCANPNLRSLVCFNKSPNFYRFRLLRVLREVRVRGDSIDWKFVKLTRLKYFQINRRVYVPKQTRFWKSISHMKGLQTIDLSYFNFHYLNIPDFLWDIKTLRHVILPYDCKPPASVDLKNLQTLRGVCVQESWRNMLPNLPNIRELKIGLPESNLNGIFKRLLGMLVHLVEVEVFIDYGGTFEISGFHSSTQYLRLVGPPNRSSVVCNLTFDVSSFPVNLTKLALSSFRLQQDPFPILCKLKNLKKLYLLSLTDMVEQITCSAGDFCQLSKLYIGYLSTNPKELKIEEGALPVLKKLTVNWCNLLLRVDGLHHVTSLQKLIWWVPNSVEREVKSRLEEEIRNQSKHVPSIIFDPWQ